MPSLAKLDLEALKRDIPNKYPRNIPQAAADAWKAWLEDVESELTSVPADWPVDKLKTATRTAPPYSDDLLELKERVIQPTPEVSIYDQYKDKNENLISFHLPSQYISPNFQNNGH